MSTLPTCTRRACWPGLASNDSITDNIEIRYPLIVYVISKGNCCSLSYNNTKPNTWRRANDYRALGYEPSLWKIKARSVKTKNNTLYSSILRDSLYFLCKPCEPSHRSCYI